MSEAARPGAGRADLRRTNFLYQDGVMLCATVRALDELGILEPSLTSGRPLAELQPGIGAAGFGYLRVGLRCLAGQGWLEADPTLDPQTTVLRWTEGGRIVACRRDHYVALGRFLASFSSSAADAWTRPWDGVRTARFLDLVDAACDRWQLDLTAGRSELTRAHLDGALVVPTVLWLAGAERLGEDGPALPGDEAGEGMGRLLTALGWLEGGGTRWTDRGRRLRPFAVHFGLVGSYLPLLARLPDLYRGRADVARSGDGGANEWHVHRELNVRASAAAHRRYFADADPLFLELFDREPVEAQPRFVADVGSGEGSWLVRVHRLVRARTLRGKRLDSDPLLMVGIDRNRAALERTRRALDAAGIPGLVLTGDVTDPEGIRAALAEHGLAIEDGLHIRSFLDHDRDHLGGDVSIPVPGWSSGAYVDDAGAPLDGAAVERDLVAHLRRWTPCVRRHGMVLLEAHCVPSAVARRHLGALHSVAFDAYHAYSHQYPIEHGAFVRCCREAGLEPAGRWERRYPSRRPFVAVSLNRFLAAGPDAPLLAPRRAAVREGGWRPDAATDLEDGRALHELLYAGGDIRYPRPWCSAPTGFVVAGALAAIEERLASAGEDDVIRVLDYGTGTGLAAIELLKACRAAGVAERLAGRGADLELHLVDLPSSWFAQGFALLRDCARVRFHALRGADGRFRPLLELTGGRRMDAVMANMVFHLIPPRALPRAVAELAGVTRPGGRLLWSSPDLGPPGRDAVLFHEPNRRLRRRWLELLSRDGGLGAASTREAQARADRRILPRAHGAEDVAAALRRRFEGQFESRSYEMLVEEVLDALLVPSNQSEFLPEIEDRARREQVIRDLMLGEVLPAMQAGPAGTGLGLNVQWTLGSFARPRR